MKNKDLSKEKNECAICQKQFVGRSSMVKHYQKHGDKKEEENRIWAKKLSKDDTRFMRCTICLVEFMETDEFIEHERDFHQKKPLMCALCCRCFSSKQQFMTHMNTHKQSYEPLKCPHCDFTTATYLAYNSHVNSHPKLDNPFMCQDCGAYFIVKKDLNEHRRKNHQTEVKTKIFQCTLCFKQYNLKCRLRKHIKTHTGERKKKAICDICGKSITVDHLKRHKQTHSEIKPHACTYCEKRFAKKTDLVQHIRTHTGEKPYACEYCGKCFTQRTPLVIHLRSHTGERPYVCHICQQGFVSKSALGVHLKNH